MVKKYKAEFKESSVKMALDSNQPIAQTARDLGLRPSTLYDWVTAYKKKNGLLDEKSDLSLEKELKRLQKLKARLEEENRILRKASEYFKSLD